MKREPGASDGCVLIVDDDELIRETMRDLVELAGCSARLAANGKEALQAISAQRPCLVILDLLMPVMTGHEVLEALRRDPATAEIPVVISTSAPDRAPTGVPVLRKPVNIEALVAYMKAHCTCAISLPTV